MRPSRSRPSSGSQEVEVRDRAQHRGIAALVVWRGRRETCVAHERTGRLVIAVVIDRRRRQHDVRLRDCAVNSVMRAARRVVVEDRQIAELGANVSRADHLGGSRCFFPAHGGDRLGVVLGCSAVAGVIVTIVWSAPGERDAPVFRPRESPDHPDGRV